MTTPQEPHSTASSRSQVWDILHYGKGKMGRSVTFVIVTIITISVAILPLQLVEAFAEFHTPLTIIEIIITALFTAEYILRIYAAPIRLKYIFSFFGIVDLLSIAPFYIGLIGTQYFRIFRLARLIRLLKISRIEAAATVERENALSKQVDLFDGEQVEQIVSRHPLFLIIGLVPPLIATTFSLIILLIAPRNPIIVSLTVTLIIFAALFLYKAWLDYRYDVIYITSHRLVFHNRHILGRNINQVSYRAIMNVKPAHMGIISFLLGYGTIIIETAAAEEGSIKHKLIRKHEKAAKDIMQKALEAKIPDQVHHSHAPPESPK